MLLSRGNASIRADVRSAHHPIGMKRLPSSCRYVDCMTDVLATWNEGAARQAVVEFVERTVSDGVPAEERVAAFALSANLG